MEQEQLKFTTIYHKARIELDISLEDYCVADCIYHLSNNPDSKIQGWCWASKKYISGFICLGERTIFRCINELVKKGLLEKDDNTKHLRTTKKWYNNVVIPKAKKEYDNLSEGMPERHSKLRQVGIVDYDKLADNINTNNNSDINTTNVVEDKPQTFGNPEINHVVDFFKSKLGGSLDGRVQENRNFANLILKRFKKDYPNGVPQTLVEKLIEVALQDKFHSKNATSFKYLYYNAQKILQSAKTTLNDPKYIKIK